MSLIKKEKILIFFLSFFIGLIFFEIIFTFQKKNYLAPYNWEQRYMLLKSMDSSSVFKNINNFFTYQPNQKIKSTAYYFINDQWIKEYEYFFPTNNLGLVQSSNTIPNTDSLLILGDSFTEGQGAYPWFEKFRNSNKNIDLQLINGGILGTGFKSWLLLHDFLVSKKISIKKIVIIFISDDYSRKVWNISSNTLDCIQNSNLCLGNENFYGEPETNNLKKFLEHLKNFREQHAIEDKKIKQKEFFNNYLPGTMTVYYFLKMKFFYPRENDQAIESLVNQYQSNILFVHIPQKDEVITGKINSVGIDAVKKIKSFNGLVFDGHAKCGFNKDDYFLHDGHPNVRGYEKVSDCVKTAINLTWKY